MPKAFTDYFQPPLQGMNVLSSRSLVIIWCPVLAEPTLFLHPNSGALVIRSIFSVLHLSPGSPCSTVTKTSSTTAVSALHVRRWIKVTSALLQPSFNLTHLCPDFTIDTIDPSLEMFYQHTRNMDQILPEKAACRSTDQHARHLEIPENH